MIEITVNGTSRTVASNSSVANLASELGLSERGGAAIAVNDRLIPRSVWATTPLEEGADIIVIKAAYGG